METNQISSLTWDNRLPGQNGWWPLTLGLTSKVLVYPNCNWFLYNCCVAAVNGLPCLPWLMQFLECKHSWIVVLTSSESLVSSLEAGLLSDYKQVAPNNWIIMVSGYFYLHQFQMIEMENCTYPPGIDYLLFLIWGGAMSGHISATLWKSHKRC